MTIRSLLLISVALVGATGCAQFRDAPAAESAPLPSAVSCADASTLKERAVDARRGIVSVKGDRAKTISGNRAKFLTSLAAVAQLHCKTNVAEADALLRKALDTGHAAEATNSEYEAARLWTEADLLATDAMALLISQLSAPSPQ